MNETTAVKPLTESEIDANAGILQGLMNHRQGLEQSTLQVFTILAALNGIIATYATNKNLAVVSGIASVIVCLFGAIIPIRKRWFRNERHGYDTQVLLKTGGARIAAETFYNPSKMSRFSLGTDLGLVAIALFWLAQTPRGEQVLSFAWGYIGSFF